MPGGSGGLRSCGGWWCMGFQLGVLAEGWLEREGEGEVEGELGSLGNASSGQSGAVGARVAGPFVWIIQCDTRETKADWWAQQVAGAALALANSQSSRGPGLTGPCCGGPGQSCQGEQGCRTWGLCVINPIMRGFTEDLDENCVHFTRTEQWQHVVTHTLESSWYFLPLGLIRKDNKFGHLGLWKHWATKQPISQSRSTWLIDIQVKSSQFYIYSLKLQSHCLNGLYSLYSGQHPLSLDPRFKWGKLETQKKWKKPQEEPQRKNPSPRTDRHAMDVACTEQNNKITEYTDFIDRISSIKTII